ncbi:MAG: SIMPL domain-containing protein, partial [Bergeyella zoohelcum]|nr:SIMPL domain-containing protein [Bergeyella zoohelcum]
VLMELEKINISNTNISRIEYSKTEALQLELKTKALLKTKQNAQKILTPIGQKVGKALHISENNYSHSYDAQPMMMYKTMATESVSSPEPINIEIKKIEISAEVFAKYAID